MQCIRYYYIFCYFKTHNDRPIYIYKVCLYVFLEKFPNLFYVLFPKELLWVAPELLAEHTVNLIPATQKGDVYSFAIVLEEIVVRGGPYEFVKNDLTTQGNRVMYCVFFFSKIVFGAQSPKRIHSERVL